MTSGVGPQYPVGVRIGHEYAGEVVEVGSEVLGFSVGDRVAAMATRGCGRCRECTGGLPFWCAQSASQRGGFAEFALVQPHAAIKMPGGMSLADGAMIEPLAVGLHGVRQAGMTPGDAVLVIGAGPVGLGAAFFAAQLGASRVAVLARTRKNEPEATVVGADTFISLDEDVPTRIIESLGGPPDIVFECSGAPNTIEESLTYVRPRGTVVVLGFCGVPDVLQPGTGLFKGARIQFSMVYSRRDFEVVADKIDRGALRATELVSETIALAALPVRFKEMQEAPGPCKVLVDPWRSQASPSA